MNKKEKIYEMNRRRFISNAGLAAAGLTLMPSVVAMNSRRKSKNDKLNIAGVGVGGRGFGVLKAVESENIVALCDVDWKYAKGCFEYFPKAKRYWDWRKMLDEMGNDIDAVVVATADHTHAIIAATAITMGKHVYVEKPLTHTVYESRLLTKLAAKYKVATQMGNQGASGDGVATTTEWIRNGEIGEVRKVEAFTDRPIWPQGLNRPTEVQPIPETMNWDLFVGPAKMRPFNEIYTPWNFRGWWDFGTGALGDMACHILHPVFKGLNLGYPIKAQGSSTLLLTDAAPVAQKVRLVFPERKSLPKVNMPEVEVHWYDGGLQPLKPDGWPAGKDMNHHGGGVLFHGSKDTLVCGCYGRDPWLLSGRTPNVPKTLPRITTSHEMDWVRACKESPETRVETLSPFSEAGPFNEMVVMGVLAVRLQSLNKELEWDGENMRFTNIGDDETIRTVISDGFKIHDGHPTFDKEWTEPVNANAFANELIKHTYRNGWTLPDMPV
ncbi:Gfo/Idh/MocA family oxidoreductase [Carboxylicivirga sediminis]|uniref:Gfo/Idh/MocA family oxidoreductase n=1 Tax=Carboxylicivirga sediminis TaxID=2006564 RepID=A0A941ITS6_9BACT|nr:Gfo/Idh/MocA family oxidoreductase [Carboxylicivirga sediminis]MBR8534451.1 Gfo/Idh/MocA family oxidoreductase [Carboxylicivirga sediminis]